MDIYAEHRCLMGEHKRIPERYRGLIIPCKECPPGPAQSRRTRFTAFWGIVAVLAPFIAGVTLVAADGPATKTGQGTDVSRNALDLDSATVLTGLAAIAAIGIQASISQSSRATALARGTSVSPRDDYMTASHYFLLTGIAAALALCIAAWRLLQWDLVTAAVALLLCWVLGVESAHNLLHEPRELAEERLARRLEARGRVTGRQDAIRALAHRTRGAVTVATGALVATTCIAAVAIDGRFATALVAVTVYVLTAFTIFGYLTLELPTRWPGVALTVFAVTYASLALALVALGRDDAGTIKWQIGAFAAFANVTTLLMVTFGLWGVGPLKPISAILLTRRDQRIHRKFALATSL
ncbi:hypothetical protein [Isoptericola sp. NPDC056605]|uniref:hypothetical protein n=1 Tax=Isoptericola sp. NPDC056605 TaxID=3345876 RepID=UPI0036936159